MKDLIFLTSPQLRLCMLIKLSYDTGVSYVIYSVDYPLKQMCVDMLRKCIPRANRSFDILRLCKDLRRVSLYLRNDHYSNLFSSLKPSIDNPLVEHDWVDPEQPSRNRQMCVLLWDAGVFSSAGFENYLNIAHV